MAPRLRKRRSRPCRPGARADRDDARRGGRPARRHAAIVRSVHDDYRVTSELYRLMPQRKRAGSGDLGEAPDAARVTGPEPREALDAARGTAAGPASHAGDSSAAYLVKSGQPRAVRLPRPGISCAIIRPAI